MSDFSTKPAIKDSPCLSTIESISMSSHNLKQPLIHTLRLIQRHSVVQALMFRFRSDCRSVSMHVQGRSRTSISRLSIRCLVS